MSPPDGRVRVALRAALVALVIVGCVYLARQVDLRAVGRAMVGASAGTVAACALINLGEIWLRALAFSYLLQRPPSAPVGLLFRIALAGQAASNLLPWRLGDLVPISLLRTHANIPTVTALAATLLEKCVEAVTLLLLAAPLPLVFPGLPAWVARGVFAQGAVGLGLIVLGWAASRPDDVRWRFVPRLPEKARIMGRPRVLVAVGALTLVQWIMDAFTLWLVLRAVGIQVHPVTPILLELAFAAASLVPTTPAQLGTLELVAVAVLGMVGVSAERALAFALVYRAFDLLPVTLAGLLVLPSLGGRAALTPGGGRDAC